MAPRFTLRDLPFAARLTLATFLIAVGLGYLAAMVQVHFQHAKPGQLLPTADDLVLKFHGEPDPSKRVSTLERLLRTPDHEDVSFDGRGSMFRAFTDRSSGWKSTLKERPQAEVVSEREHERDAIMAWLKGGLSRSDHEKDKMARPESLKDKPFTKEFLNDDDSIKIQSLFTERCVRCHSADGDDNKARSFPLDKYEQIKAYAKVDTGAMSLPALAQTTHTHLLSFAMLFMLTGVIFGLTSYSAWLRVPIAPIVLIAQVADVACWWLARIDGSMGILFAEMILVTGAIVGVGLVIQIVLSLFDLFGMTGKALLVLLLIAAGMGGGIAKQKFIDAQLQRESADTAPAAEKSN